MQAVYLDWTASISLLVSASEDEPGYPEDWLAGDPSSIRSRGWVGNGKAWLFETGIRPEEMGTSTS